MSTLRYYALSVYCKFDDDVIVKECCSGERMKDSKKLTHAAIVVNNLDEDQMVSNLYLSHRIVIGFRRAVSVPLKSS